MSPCCLRVRRRCRSAGVGLLPSNVTSRALRSAGGRPSCPLGGPPAPDSRHTRCRRTPAHSTTPCVLLHPPTRPQLRVGLLAQSAQCSLHPSRSDAPSLIIHASFVTSSFQTILRSFSLVCSLCSFLYWAFAPPASALASGSVWVRAACGLRALCGGL